MDPLDNNPPFFDLVGDMRAMRRLKPDPVPLELIRRVLRAGVQAPSGQNTQPWAFLLLAEPEPKKWFSDRYVAAIRVRMNPAADPDRATSLGRQLRAMHYQLEHMHETPYLLLVCGKRDWPFRVPHSERVGLAPPSYGSVFPCIQNILLACRGLGLGASLTTMHQVFEAELQERFGIPEEYGMVATIPIGWPLGRFGPVRRRPAEDVTWFDAWGNVEPRQE